MAAETEVSSTSETSIMNVIIESLRLEESKQESSRLKVITDQGDYSHIVQYTWHEDDGDVVWAHFAINDSSPLMDVLVRFRGDRFVSETLRVSFNKAIAEHRIKDELASALSAAKDWWTTVGQEIYESDNTKSKRTTPRNKKNKCRSKNGSKKTPIVEVEEPTTGGMKTAQDVINRIVWDKLLPAEHFTVGYIDRFVGVVEKSFNTFNWSAFNEVDPEATAIPRHRIVYLKYKTAKVWDRENRIDHVFGSVGGSELRPIEVIIDEENEKDGTVVSAEAEIIHHVVPSTSTVEHTTNSTVSDVISLNKRPSHYLCLRITNPKIVARLQDLQSDIRQTYLGYVDRFQPDTNFHVTLALFCDDDEDQIVQKINATISRAGDDIADVMNNMTLDIEGVALLKQYRVIVAKLTHSAATEKLLSLVSGYFQEDNVPAYMYPATGVHLTLCKLKSVRDVSQWTQLSNWCSMLKLSEHETNAKMSLQKVGPANVGVELLHGGVEAREEETELAKFVETKQLYGVHVRNAHEYVYRAASVGAKSFAFFPVEKTSTDHIETPTTAEIADFKSAYQKCSIAPTSIVPHGPYALMLAADPTTVLDTLTHDDYSTRITSSMECMINHMEWCMHMGIQLYNIHAYTHGVKVSDDSIVREQFLKMAADNLNIVLARTKDTNVTILLETGCNAVGEPTGTFDELSTIISHITDKSRIGVCLDTCHSFAAGYDLRTLVACQETFAEFDRVIGLQYLKAFHLNDSRFELNSRIDRHAHIGKGHIREVCFSRILEHFGHLPMVLETPDHELDQQLGDMTTLNRLAQQLAVAEEDDKVEDELRQEEATSSLDVAELNVKIMKNFERTCERRADISLKEMNRQRLEAFLVQHWPTENVRVVLIGGSGMNIGTKSSDTDLALLVGNGSIKYAGDWHYKLQMLEKVSRLLSKDYIFHDLLSIISVEVRTGYVPILRLNVRSYLGDNHIDINCNDLSAVRDAHLMRAYVSLDDRVAPLCMHMKRWAAAHGINDASQGYPNGYSYVLMVVHFMQSQAILPCLQSQYPRYFNDSTEVGVLASRDCPEIIYKTMSKTSTASVGELFIDMMKYYSKVDFSEQFVSVGRGCLMERSAINEHDNTDARTAGDVRMYIEDPFERRNTARCVIDEKKMEEVVELFRKSQFDINVANPAV